MGFINNFVNDFIKSTNNLERLCIIRLSLFEEQKPFIFVEIVFYDRNENKSKDFVLKFHEFTNNKFKVPLK